MNFSEHPRSSTRYGIRALHRRGLLRGLALDEEDRQTVGTILVWIATVFILATAGALAAGVAFRLFQIVSGI